MAHRKNACWILMFLILSGVGTLLLVPPPMYDTADSHPRSIINSIGMKLNLVPSGRFLMGSPTTEEGRAPSRSGARLELWISHEKLCAGLPTPHTC